MTNKCALAIALAAFAAGAARGASVTVVCSSLKVLPRAAPPAVTSCAQLKAAQNEFEALQVVVSGGATGLVGLRVDKPVLTRDGTTSTIPADSIRLYREELVNLTAPTNNEGAVGASATNPIPYPDPLIPAQETTTTASPCSAGTAGCQPNGWREAVTTETRSAFPFAVPANENRVVLVDVHVPDGTAAAHYSGSVNVSGSFPDGTPFSGSVAIGLTVRPFRLPSTSSLPSFFGFSVDATCAAHAGGTSCATVDSFHFWSRFYGRFLLDHRITIRLPDDSNTVGSLDYANVEARFTRDYAGLINGTDGNARQLAGARATSLIYPWFNPRDTDSVKRDKARNWGQYAMGQAWFPIMFDYTGDEPQVGRLTTWDMTAARANIIQAAFPNFRTSANAQLSDYTNFVQVHGGGNFLDILIPLWDQLDKPQTGNLAPTYGSFLGRPNRYRWGYQSCSTSNGCGDPTHVNWISFVVDAIGVQNRAEPWMHFIYNPDNAPSGMMYFDVAQLIGTAWNTGGLSGSTGNGDGTFVYAGTPATIGGTSHEPVASYRLKMLREGLEDYEYLRMCAQKDPARARRNALSVFPMNASNSGSTYHASNYPDPAAPTAYTTNLETARDDLAACIGAPSLVRNPAASIVKSGDYNADGRSDFAIWRPTDGTWWIMDNATGASFTQQWGLPGDIPVPGDYDNDGITDFAVWRPAEGNWYFVPSSIGYPFSDVVQWGVPGDIPVPGDYDGDGRTDFAIWRPATGEWWVMSNATRIATVRQWGLPGDIPVPGDYDGDGKTDFAIWRPSAGDFWIVNSSTGATDVRRLGIPGDVPVPGDYDGDGRTDLAVWRPADGNWIVLSSSTGAQTIQQWGVEGDIPVPGDNDGDGRTDVAIWRPTDGNWWIIGSGTGMRIQQWGIPDDIPVTNTRAAAFIHRNALKVSSNDFEGHRESDFAIWRPNDGTWWILDSARLTPRVQQWGLSGDVPASGDYDGDGRTDFAIWRPSDGTWWVIDSSSGRSRVQQWGLSGDVAVPGDYDGDGKTDFAIWRPSDGNWWVIDSSSGRGRVQQWGVPGDVPVPGDYDGDGKTDFAIWRPSDGTWWVIDSSTGRGRVQQWGVRGDIPVPGDYDGDGKTDFAIWRPSDGTWWIINSSNGATPVQQWGLSGDVPVPGDHDGDGRTDLVVWRPQEGNWYILQSSNGVVRLQQWGVPGDKPI